MMFGIDISSWQGNMNLKAVPADFVVVKATGGTEYVNPYFKQKARETIETGKLLGVYHYANEDYCKGSAEEEAKFFIENTKEYIGKAIFVLDWESSNKWDVKWAKQFLMIVEELIGYPPIFYTYTSVLNSYDFSSINNYPLWLANYGWNNLEYGYRKIESPPPNPYFNYVPLYQYSSNTILEGYGSRLDVNIFYGNKQDWLNLMNNKIIEIEKEESEEENMIEFAFKYGGAMYYTVNKEIQVMKSADEWTVLQAVYEQCARHKKAKEVKIYVTDWTGNEGTFNAWCRLCNYDPKEFKNAVTKGIDDIKKELGFE